MNAPAVPEDTNKRADEILRMQAAQAAHMSELLMRQARGTSVPAERE